MKTKFRCGAYIPSICPFKQHHPSSFIPGGKMITRFIKLDCGDNVN